MPQPRSENPSAPPGRSRSAAGTALCLLLLCLSSLAPAGEFAVTARQRDARPLAGAVILLESEAENGPAAAPVAAVMDQIDQAFVPDVLVIPVHSTVQFPNSDAISHQVYSFSSTKAFQLPLYRGKPYPPVEFDRTGVVTLGCNIHDNMVGYILVTRAAYFGRTDEKGQWAAADVAPGRYVLRLWHPLLNESQDVSRAVTVEAAGGGAELRLSRNLRPAPLTDRPHSWDY
jgi:plastocyanin